MECPYWVTVCVLFRSTVIRQRIIDRLTPNRQPRWTIDKVTQVSANEYACLKDLFSLVSTLPGRGRVLQKMSGLKDAELPHSEDTSARSSNAARIKAPRNCTRSVPRTFCRPLRWCSFTRWNVPRLVSQECAAQTSKRMNAISVTKNEI